MVYVLSHQEGLVSRIPYADADQFHGFTGSRPRTAYVHSISGYRKQDVTWSCTIVFCSCPR